MSWAVPKGLPPSPKQRGHLAKQTEDHPMAYADFAGDIPKGEYGGGSVTIWDAGTYELEKWTDDEVKVVFHGERVERALRVPAHRQARRRGQPRQRLARPPHGPAAAARLAAAARAARAHAGDRGGSADRRRLDVRVQVGRRARAGLRRRRPRAPDEPHRPGDHRRLPGGPGGRAGARVDVGASRRRDRGDGPRRPAELRGAAAPDARQLRVGGASPARAPRRSPTCPSTCSTSMAGSCWTSPTTSGGDCSTSCPSRSRRRSPPRVLR